MDGEEEGAVLEVMRSGWIGMGPRCEEFEERFAAYVGAPHAVSVSSCTAAIHLALRAVGIGQGDEVITTPLTFVATVNAILDAGARPVLVDIDPETLNMDPERCEMAITERTKAILPVHFAGLPADMGRICSIAANRGIRVIEDAAHAVGAEWNTRRIGGIPGSIACFSFYPNKNLATFEGGMVTTDSPEIAERVKVMRLHGLDKDAWKRYGEGAKRKLSEAVMWGMKGNMTDVQAAVALVQLGKLDGFMGAREANALRYDALFCRLPVRRPLARSGDRHGLHLYNLLLDASKLDVSRDEIVDEICGAGIGATVHYLPVHLHLHFQQVLGYGRGSFHAAECASETIITLPVQPKLSGDEVEYIGATVKSIIERHCVT
jgi:dTDP-4-amino-4,6-dideoxygalactose transaminase